MGSLEGKHPEFCRETQVAKIIIVWGKKKEYSNYGKTSEGRST
jgi:hypothetical protein